MSLPTRLSYAFIAVLLIAAGWLHLATPFLAVMFSYFALHALSFRGRKWLGVTLYLILLTGAGIGFYIFISNAIVAVPKIAETTIPVVLEWAEKQRIELPFSDYASLRKIAIDKVKLDIADLGEHATFAVLQGAAILIGIVVAVSMFLNSRFDLANDRPSASNNLYTVTANEVAERFRTFYRSFATVMGAQIVISAINTFFTAVFLIWNDFPYPKVIIGATFLCGLLPIVGNLISNTLIVGVGFTISPKMALLALLFLVVLHKAEYFLNSKIIGDRIQNPMWLTLIGLVLGEKLMGIPGMVLAPVVLHYIKVEAKRNRLSQHDGRQVVTPADPPA
jgi:predicted PurR-regulated permease PerM